MFAYRQLLKREFKLHFRSGGDWGGSLTFFLLPPFLFSLGAGGGGAMGLASALSMVFLTAMLAMISGADRMFYSDWQNGYIDTVRLQSFSVMTYIWAKITAFAAYLVAPIVIMGPLVLNLIYAPPVGWNALMALAGIMALFGVVMALFGAMISALVTASRGAAALMFVLLLPLLVPCLIFAVACGQAVVQSGDWYPPLAGLIAIALVAAAICPVVAGYCIQHLDD